eukprot:gb/GECG01009677.1/.p1 GENE.gb/GECG01009677.1/~~gb/GECG01009677.1/.p1  ORF type:complete len:126 (+),score=3.91 gb/GECG01009677.1/:1-378(+)
MPLPRHIRKPANRRSTIPRPHQGRPEFPAKVLHAKPGTKEVELYTAYKGPGQGALRTWIRTYLPSLRYHNQEIIWRHKGKQEGDATIRIVSDSGEKTLNVTQEKMSHGQIFEALVQSSPTDQAER